MWLLSNLRNRKLERHALVIFLMIFRLKFCLTIGTPHFLCSSPCPICQFCHCLQWDEVGNAIYQLNTSTHQNPPRTSQIPLDLNRAFFNVQINKAIHYVTIKRDKSNFGITTNRINDQIQECGGRLLVNPKTASKVIFKAKPDKMHAPILIQN